MARTPKPTKTPTTRRPPKPQPRASTAQTFVEKGARRGKASNKPEVSESEEDEPGSASENDEFKVGLSRMLETLSNKTRSSGLKTKKESLYASTRQAAMDVSTMGLRYIEDAREVIKDLRKEDDSIERLFEELEELCLAAKTAFLSASKDMDPLIDDIASKREAEVETGLEIVRSNSVRRCSALKKKSRNARRRVEEVRALERDASDASALIKHFKRLLYT